MGALLAAAGIVGLLLIPLGLPGLWVIVLGILGYGWLTGFATVKAWLLVLVIGLALLGEVVEAWIGFRFARRYGGSSRAGWGALLGGLVGAIVGVPLPIVGSVIGAFVGAFAGAALLSTPGSAVGHRDESRMGAVLGRAAAAAVNMAIGLVMVVIGVFAALRH